MKVINIHTRIINQSPNILLPLILSLTSKQDQFWPVEKWPPMRLDSGLTVGSKGGHGPIAYTISECDNTSCIGFSFDQPKGFDGGHRFHIQHLDNNQTKLTHIIDMEARGLAIMLWLVGIRWLHDALIEDAFDKLENHFLDQKKCTPWNPWVRFLRFVLK